MSFNPMDDFICDPKRILKAIARYRAADLRNISLDEVVELFRCVFTLMPLRTAIIGCTIFRGRKINDNDPHDFKSKVWCPPSCSVKKMGRFNDVNQSVFYASFNPVIAIKEARIQPGEYFSLAVYILCAQEDGLDSTIMMLPRSNLKGLSKTQEIYSMIFDDFVYVEATRPVGVGTEYQYKASCAIAKIFLNMPYKDSLIYPSMFDFNEKNIVVTEESAKKRIKLVEVAKCQYHGDDADFNPIISIYEKAFAKETSDELIYLPFHPDARNTALKKDDCLHGTSIKERLQETMDKIEKGEI